MRLRRFSVLLAAQSRPQHTQGPEVWLQHHEALSLQWGWTKALGTKSAFSVKTQTHLGGIQDQSPSRRWNCMSAADIWTVMELGVVPGCTKSHAPLQCCFGGGRKKSNSAHQECLNKKGILMVSQQNSVWQKVQLNIKCNRLLFYQEIKSFLEKKQKNTVFRSDQVVFIQMLYIQIIYFSDARNKICIVIQSIDIHSFQQVC